MTHCLPAQKPRVAILASPATRLPGGSARRFVDANPEKLRSVHILATGGVAKGLFTGRSDLEVTSFKDSKQGGLTKITNEIVERRCDVVITFADLNRPESLSSPENNTLLNQALWNRRQAIINERTADIWASGQSGVIDPAQETLALIAHSSTSDRNPKLEIKAFARTFANELSRFQRIICTGTTGKELAESVPQLAEKLFAFKSGMRGGDAQIANVIDDGECQHVVFLINPGWAQPHRDDVLTFVNTCRRKDVNTLFTLKDAWRWAGQLRAELKA